MNSGGIPSLARHLVKHAQLQPVLKLAAQRMRSLELEGLAANRLVEGDIAQPDAGQGRQIHGDIEVDLEAWIPQADIHLAAIDHQLVEAPLGEAIDMQAAMETPHQKPWVEIVGLGRLPAFAPGSRGLDHRLQFTARPCQAVFADATLEVAKPFDQSLVFQILKRCDRSDGEIKGTPRRRSLKCRLPHSSSRTTKGVQRSARISAALATGQN